MAKRTNNHLKTEVRISKPPLKLYVGLGVFGAMVIIAAMIIFRFEFGVILLVVGGVSGLWFIGKVVKSVGGGVVWCLHTYHDYNHKVRMDDAEYQKSYLLSVNRTEFLYDSRSGSVVIEAMTHATPGQAKLLPDGEQPQQRRTLHQLIEVARHIAFLGETGSGKTSQMSHAIETQIRLNPGALSIVMDSHIKKNTWPQVNETIWRYEDMAARVNWLFGELDKRTNPQNDDDWQTIIVAIDELPAVMDECREIDKNTKRYFTRLLREAWKFDIFFVVGTQSQLADDIDLNSATRKNFWWFGLEPEMTRRNVGMLLDNKFRPVEEIELAGPYYSNSGGRFFNRSQQVRRLPPPEVETDNDNKKLVEFRRLVIEEEYSKNQASQEVFGKPFAGTSHCNRLNSVLD